MFVKPFWTNTERNHITTSFLKLHSLNRCSFTCFWRCVSFDRENRMPTMCSRRSLLWSCSSTFSMLPAVPSLPSAALLPPSAVMMRRPNTWKIYKNQWELYILNKMRGAIVWKIQDKHQNIILHLNIKTSTLLTCPVINLNTLSVSCSQALCWIVRGECWRRGLEPEPSPPSPPRTLTCRTRTLWSGPLSSTTMVVITSSEWKWLH